MSKTVRYYMIILLICSIIGISYDVNKLALSIYNKLFILIILTTWGYATYKIYYMFMVVNEELDTSYEMRKGLAPKYGKVDDKPNIDNQLNTKTIAHHLKQNGYENITHDTKLKLNEKDDK